LYEYDELTVEAKVNVQCDKYVGQYFNNPKQTCPTHIEMIPHYPQQKISISNQFTRITNMFESKIQQYKVGHEAEEQCAKTWKISKAFLPHVDWTSFCKECKMCRGYKQYRMTKAIHRQWPTMRREKRWNRAETDVCPICGKEPETIQHIFQCKHDVIKAHRSKSLAEFKTSMQKFKTCPLLLAHVHRILQQYCGNYNVSEMKDKTTSQYGNAFYKLVATAINDQNNNLGIQNMMFGIISREFRECQVAYYKFNNYGRNYTDARWGKWFIRSLLDFTLKLWTYRCDILHAKKEGTMEGRLRSLAESWLVQLRFQPTLILVQSRYLFNRSPKHFRKGDLRAVMAWVRRMENELKEAKMEKQTSDIRKWVKMSPRCNINQQKSPQKCDDDDSDSSTESNGVSILSFDIDSQRATHDLFLEHDSISTFPTYSSHDLVPIAERQQEMKVPKMITTDHINIQKTCMKYETDDSDSDDLYANIRMRKASKRTILVGTEDESSSDMSVENDW